MDLGLDEGGVWELNEPDFFIPQSLYFDCFC